MIPDLNEIDAQLVTDVSNGQLALSADGSFIYQPDPGFLGTDTFVYEASDGIDSDTATVTIEVFAPTDSSLIAEEDAHVSDDDATRNFGQAAELVLYHETGTDRDDPIWAYAKFPLSEFSGELREATIDVTPTFVRDSNTTNLRVFAVGDDSWSEDTITWSNQPAWGSQVGVVGHTQAEIGGRISADVTRHVIEAIAQGREDLSLESHFGKTLLTGSMPTIRHATPAANTLTKRSTPSFLSAASAVE